MGPRGKGGDATRPHTGWHLGFLVASLVSRPQAIGCPSETHSVRMFLINCEKHINSSHFSRQTQAQVKRDTRVNTCDICLAPITQSCPGHHCQPSPGRTDPSLWVIKAFSLSLWLLDKQDVKQSAGTLEPAVLGVGHSPSPALQGSASTATVGERLPSRAGPSCCGTSIPLGRHPPSIP